MGAQGIVVQPGQGQVSSTTPGREFALKLLGGATGDSIMIFEETVPAGTKSTLHLHYDSDEVAYVLSGEVTFMIGDEVSVGGAGAYAFMPRGVPHAWKSTGARGPSPSSSRTLLAGASRASSRRASRQQRKLWPACACTASATLASALNSG